MKDKNVTKVVFWCLILITILVDCNYHKNGILQSKLFYIHFLLSTYLLYLKSNFWSIKNIDWADSWIYNIDILV